MKAGADMDDVLKRRFYFYSGMMSPTNQETIATEKRACFLQPPKPWGRGRATHRETPGSAGRQMEQGKIMVDGLSCGFLWHKGKSEAG